MMLDISNGAHKFLKHLQQPELYKQIARRIFALSENPKPQDFKHVSGYPGHFTINEGEYRIIYKIDGEIIMVVDIGKRNDDEVYRKMKRVVG